ncbi:MAG: ribonuclease H family protein [Candidatus Saccharimonadales bacterium]
MSVTIYTDGACINNGRPGARAGFGVWFGPEDPRNISEIVSGDRHTNQIAELEACAVALEHPVCEGKQVHLYTDSQYTIKCVTEYIPSWCLRYPRGDWKTADDQPVKNRNLLQRLKVASERIDVQWHFVKGHSGNEGNDGADGLAHKAAMRAILRDGIPVSQFKRPSPERAQKKKAEKKSRFFKILKDKAAKEQAGS